MASHDGNSFQWKINVAMRIFLVFVVCFLPASCFLLLLGPALLGPALLCLILLFLLRLPSSAPPALLFLFSASCSDFFLYFFILFLPSNIPFAFPALLLFLLCSAWSCSALLDGGASPFLTKITFSFLPPKIPAIFSKTSPHLLYI